MIRRNGSASAFTAGVAFTRSRSEGAKTYPSGQECLVDRAVDFVLLARTGEAGDENAHSCKERVNKDDNDDKNL